MSWFGYGITFSGFDPRVFIGAIDARLSNRPGFDRGTIAGTIGAHELVHKITGIGNQPYDADNPNLMMVAPDSVLLTPGTLPEDLQLTPDQARQLFERCRDKHPLTPAGAGGGGAGGTDSGLFLFRMPGETPYFGLTSYGLLFGYLTPVLRAKYF